jgi:hypothetical protein
VRLEKLGQVKYPTGNRTRDLPACSIVPQPTTVLLVNQDYKFIPSNVWMAVNNELERIWPIAVAVRSKV